MGTHVIMQTGGNRIRTEPVNGPRCIISFDGIHNQQMFRLADVIHEHIAERAPIHDQNVFRKTVFLLKLPHEMHTKALIPEKDIPQAHDG